jgi:hypothetical protein
MLVSPIPPAGIRPRFDLDLQIHRHAHHRVQLFGVPRQRGANSKVLQVLGGKTARRIELTKIAAAGEAQF